MDLSIIIVNYNVKHFIEQCLLSVRKAIEGMQAEVIVVDNNSVDGSQQMLREKFADEIILIENTGNPGFSKANNQGIAIAKGRYVLLLNPDTVVEEKTFHTCLAFMDARPKAGALGVKMIDGKGHFLPESKRALPTPWVSFYKIFGLSALFPKSRRFGKYHLSYLDKDENHEIEILSGAFMWMRKSALDEIGYLDEDFFMYGEDIDLSYRFILANYQNFYLADTQIIHYKGESTKKGSLNYVKVFYNAMIIFAEKHFGGSRKRLFILGIRFAVYLRALLAIVYRIYQRWGFPILEAILVYGAIQGIKEYWEHYVKFIEGGTYPIEFDLIAAPIYTLVFISLLSIAGAYQKPYRIRPLITATLSGFIAIATVSYMFPQINFSRAIVGLSSIFTLIIAITTRGIINWRERGSFFFTELSPKRVLIAGGDEDGLNRVGHLLLQEVDEPVELVGSIAPENIANIDPSWETLGTFEQLDEIIRFYRVEEVIFDNKSISTERILDLMLQLKDQDIDYKIVPPDADYIIGPQAIYLSRFGRQILYNLQKPSQRLHKRIFDTSASLLMLMIFPVSFFLYKRPLAAFSGLWKVLISQKHMVSYIPPGEKDLPKLKPGLLSILQRVSNRHQIKQLNLNRLNSYYARVYTWYMDLEILLKAWRKIGFETQTSTLDPNTTQNIHTKEK